jgi:UDP-4-amino-4,6-dideoxy-N-acetyl-beta-L-altrosamine transaminase
MIPYSCQTVSDADVDAVIKVLRSDFLTQGPIVPEFESKVASYCGAQYAVAVNSATSALHIACLALGVQKGDWVWTTPITFVASANCAVYCGANIDFVDIDPQTYNISLDCLADKLAKAEGMNKLPKVLIPVHMCGLSCDMASIHELSRRYGFKIIEDASHAIGGKYRDSPIGCCEFSDVTVLSFHPAKVITAVEGGIALTNNSQLAESLALLREHGITRNPALMSIHHPKESWQYQQVALGFNYRMTDVHAALGLSQMDRLDEFVSTRNNIADRYNTLLDDLPLRLPLRRVGYRSAFHLYIVRINHDGTGLGQAELRRRMEEADIRTGLHYIPVYRQPFYKERGFAPGYCPEAEKYFLEAVSIPIYPTLMQEQQDLVADAMRAALQR